MEGVSHILIDLNQESLDQYFSHNISYKEGDNWYYDINP